MPTYEYVCERCGHEFEKFQSIADKALTICPQELCAQRKWGKGKVKKVIGAGAGLIFKGSGFYITDYRSEKYKEAAKKEAAGPGSAGGESKQGGADKAASSDPASKPAKSESKTPKAQKPKD